MSNALACPECRRSQTIVTNSRANHSRGLESIYRARECTSCKHRFYTIEIERTNGYVSTLSLAEKIARLPDARQDMIKQLVGMLS